MRTTTGRPFSTMTNNTSPKLGTIALWTGKKESVIYSGSLELYAVPDEPNEYQKFSVNLFYPKDDKAKFTTALYSGSVSINFGQGWEVAGHIDFHKSESPKLVAKGYIKWKIQDLPTMKVLLFRNDNVAGKENAPKFKGILVENDSEKKNDRPISKKAVNTPVKPLHTGQWDEGLF